MNALWSGARKNRSSTRSSTNSIPRKRVDTWRWMWPPRNRCAAALHGMLRAKSG